MDKVKRIKKSLGLATALFVSVPFSTGVAVAGPGVRADQASKADVRSTAPGLRLKKTRRREKAVKKVLKREQSKGSVIKRDNSTEALPRRDGPTGSYTPTK